ncbi:uncharacterized protein ColSpa_05909 [Colletotrichum spaethianum]|uniref:Uncharacterized protein n=1 Tax=Colletotrichum spaethianum TaxID=700344 RepID=A0AA37P223_9PEZI|nr:uncharacterized protein ColSpa_05909 [Colletotrichum spaethianum]GKT45728.1 hypothetical protein ColSpa_05909 [Colletotrichum spaethianum]
MDITDAAEAMFNDWYAEWISYKRGFAYLLFVDLYLRKHSYSYDFATAGPLDLIVVGLAKRNRQGENVRARDWLKCLKKSLGNDEFPIEEHFEGMLRGRQILDFNGLFLGDPSNELKPGQLPIMQFGFEKRSLNSRVITGLIPESPAAAAGLWEGAHIVSTSRASDCIDNVRETYKVVIQSGDQTRLIEYFPRTKQTAPAWQLEE